MANGKGNEPATRAELKTEVQALRTDLETVRTELKTSINKVAAEVVKTQAEMRGMRHTMTGMATKDDVSRILAAIDSFAGKAVSYDRKSHSHGAILMDHEDKLRTHDRRLTSLESKA